MVYQGKYADPPVEGQRRGGHDEVGHEEAVIELAVISRGEMALPYPCLPLLPKTLRNTLMEDATLSPQKHKYPNQHQRRRNAQQTILDSAERRLRQQSIASHSLMVYVLSKHWHFSEPESLFPIKLILPKQVRRHPSSQGLAPGSGDYFRHSPHPADSYLELWIFSH